MKITDDRVNLINEECISNCKTRSTTIVNATELTMLTPISNPCAVSMALLGQLFIQRIQLSHLKVQKGCL